MNRYPVWVYAIVAIAYLVLTVGSLLMSFFDDPSSDCPECPGLVAIPPGPFRMGDLDGASFIQTTGQSGLPFDAHYGDFIDRWLNNVGLPIPLGGAAVEALGTQELTLQP